ncbi:MAG: precorrin-6y C5,15-methyltransferase (decarboxylating) subunit CbiE [Chloroflexota bacterium]
MKVDSAIVIIGMSAAGRDGLPSFLLEAILSADVLVGGRRHLGYFPEFSGECIAITKSVEAMVPRFQEAVEAGQQVVVLASGDPLFYGIGASLRRYFSSEQLHIIPSPTSFQLAFAALAEPWHDAALLSAHGRSLEEVVRQAIGVTKMAILTDNQHTPAVIAQALMDANISSTSACAVCENLGSSEERIVRSTLADVSQETFAPLNVFVVWHEGVNDSQPRIGIPDKKFATSNHQITKREVRLLVLAELDLQPNEVMWDIGAGSGAVSIEAGRMQPRASVYAVEKRDAFFAYMQENLQRFPAPNVRLTYGLAPDAFVDWPAPHAVFIGGSGGQLESLIEVVCKRLHVGGRLVINLATIENLAIARKLLPNATINQVQLSQSVPILEMMRFNALNPVFMVKWVK